MNPALRQEYLAALGLEGWVVRGKSAPIAAPREVIAAVESPVALVRAVPPGAIARPDSGPRDAGVPGGNSPAREAGVGWPELRARVAACTRCGLCNTRTQTVFGVGSPTAQWLIVGEAPGADEDRQGEPFVGRAGQLLNSMLRAIGLTREQVYIANVLK